MTTTIVKATREMTPQTFNALNRVNKLHELRLTTISIHNGAPVVLWTEWYQLAAYWLGDNSVPNMMHYSVFDTGPTTNTTIKPHYYKLYEVAPKHYKNNTIVYLYIAHRPILFKGTTVEAWYVNEEFVTKQRI